MPHIQSFALVDCNNFYVSCERVFRPDLRYKPVICLSNNDGCAVSRSNEAKALGIKMGDPLFKIKDLVKKHKVEVFSSNYALYADMSNRVMSILSEYSPHQEVYSIDESFLDLTGMCDINNTIRNIKNRVIQHTAIPVCVGVGQSKTLAKLANFISKRHPKSNGVFNFNDLNEKQKFSIFRNLPVEEVWGIGRKLTNALEEMGIMTIEQLISSNIPLMRNKFGVVMEKTIRELRGEPCMQLEEIAPNKQQIINSRSFGQVVYEIYDLENALSHFVSNAALKLRAQKSVAKLLSVFIMTDRFNQNAQYCPHMTYPLIMPTACSITLLRAANACLLQIYKKGYAYKKAGIVLTGITANDCVQEDLFQVSTGNSELMTTIDDINKRYGKGALRLSQNDSKGNWRMRQDRMSPAYTTNWEDLPICK